MELFMISVGDIDGNYSTVRENPRAPKWAIRKKYYDNTDIKQALERGVCYFLFKPSKISCDRVGVNHGLVGLAKIKKIVEREIGPLVALSETNEERGWVGEGFDYDLIFESYWDLEQLYNSDVFSYKNISKFKKLCTSAAYYHISDNNKDLYDYISKHIIYCIENIRPMFNDTINESSIYPNG